MSRGPSQIQYLNTNKISVSKGTMNELGELQQLFFETVTTICKRDYDKQQIKVWASGISNLMRWQRIVSEQFLLVAKIEEKIVGFGSLNNGDRIHMLYVHKDFQRNGVANKLYTGLENEACRQGKKSIHSDVSKTALNFFISKGFTIEFEQVVVKGDIALTNFKMTKILIHN